MKARQIKGGNSGISARSQAGFSMLEVLVSLLLVSLAMLGQAGLQISSMKLSKSAGSRMQATLLSAEIAERIENNKTAALAGSYVVTPASSTAAVAANDCLANKCSPSDLASYDLAAWQARVDATLPSATWEITQVAGNPSTYTVVVTWQDRRDNATLVNHATTGTVETLAVTSTKVIYQ